MAALWNCTYELRENRVVVSTGRLTLEEQPQPGVVLKLGHRDVRIDEVLPASGEVHLVLQPA
jgi:hypothetical protein